MSVSQLASAVGEGGDGGWRRPRSESSADAESVYMTNAVLSDSGYAQASRRSSVSTVPPDREESFPFNLQLSLADG